MGCKCTTPAVVPRGSCEISFLIDRTRYPTPGNMCFRNALNRPLDNRWRSSDAADLLVLSTLPGGAAAVLCEAVRRASDLGVPLLLSVRDFQMLMRELPEEGRMRGDRAKRSGWKLTSVTLRGRTSEWRALRKTARTEQVRTLVNALVATSEGFPDVGYWESIGSWLPPLVPERRRVVSPETLIGIGLCRKTQHLRTIAGRRVRCGSV